MNENNSFDSSEEASVKERKRKILLQEKQAELDLYNLMNSSAGRNVIGRILSTRSPYTKSFASDPYNTAFNEGLRWAGCLIVNELIRVCPELYMQLQMETINKGKETTNE
jgi:hypothetical protein